MQHSPTRSAPITRPSHLALDIGPTIAPLLKWAGGKRWLVPYLRPLLEEHRDRRLVEPFCGGLAVTLGLVPKRALLNDVNPHLINFYRWVKRGLVLDIPLRNSECGYYRNRNRFNKLLSSGQGDAAEAAALFYYLNRTGYNGLCRFNSTGGFNVPFGRYKTIGYRTDFTDHQRLFRRYAFTCLDFETIPIEDSDLIYADPPYDVPFTHYSQGGFGWDDQVRAAEWLARHPGPVILSNQATGRIVDLYESLGFDLEFLDAPRMISCSGDRTPAREVLATRNL